MTTPTLTAPAKSAGPILTGILLTVIGTLVLQVTQQVLVASTQRQALLDAVAELGGATAPQAAASFPVGLALGGLLTLAGLILLAVGAVRLARSVDFLTATKHAELAFDLAATDDPSQ